MANPIIDEFAIESIKDILQLGHLQTCQGDTPITIELGKEFARQPFLLMTVDVPTAPIEQNIYLRAFFVQTFRAAGLCGKQLVMSEDTPTSCRIRRYFLLRHSQSASTHNDANTLLEFGLKQMVEFNLPILVYGNGETVFTVPRVSQLMTVIGIQQSVTLDEIAQARDATHYRFVGAIIPTSLSTTMGFARYGLL